MNKYSGKTKAELEEIGCPEGASTQELLDFCQAIEEAMEREKPAEVKFVERLLRNPISVKRLEYVVDEERTVGAGQHYCRIDFSNVFGEHVIEMVRGQIVQPTLPSFIADDLAFFLFDICILEMMDFDGVEMCDHLEHMLNDNMCTKSHPAAVEFIKTMGAN